MSDRVLSSAEAKAAVQQMQAIINGGLAEQLGKLDAQGKTLSRPDVWDGPLAHTFRESTWPETRAALEKAKSELEELRGQIHQISTNIFTAGGGS